MPLLKTCRPCAFDGDCIRQKDLAASTKNLGLLTVTHSCRQRQNKYAPGQPVWVEVFDAPNDTESGYYGEDRRLLCWFPGTFLKICTPNTQGLVMVLAGATPEGFASNEEFGTDGFEPYKGGAYGICRAPWSRIKPREGEIEPLCDLCKEPPALKGQNCANFGMSICPCTESAGVGAILQNGRAC